MVNFLAAWCCIYI